MTIKNIIFFLSGAVIGSGVTAFLCNSMYKEKLEKQANDIHIFYTTNKPTTVEVKAPEKEEKKDFSKTYTDIITQHNYSNIPLQDNKPDTNRVPVPGRDIYVIAKEFAGTDYCDCVDDDKKGEQYKLHPETYDHWANGVLTDASGRPLSNSEIANLVGLDYADHLNDVDSGNVTYFRNELLKLDIEVYDNGEEEYHDPTTNIVDDED